MKIYTVTISVILFLSIDCHADWVIKNGISCGDDFFNRPSEQKAILATIGSVFKEKNIATAESCLGWGGSNGKEWYEVSDDGKIFGVNIDTREYLGEWNVNYFDDSELEPDIKNVYSRYEHELEVGSKSSLSEAYGCFYKNPVKSMDIDGDENQELLIFTQDVFNVLQITFFSAVSKKSIYSQRILNYDAYKNTFLSLSDGEEPNASSPLANEPTDSQYFSVIAEEHSLRVRNDEPGLIGLSKIYIDDFDGDHKKDFISWRKLYKSRENQDPIKGFELITDRVIHYKLIDGAYKKQPTESNVVKGWLTAKNLTWKKGYPSKSECTGQEGQFIPEMHDPLLNDPDVLR